MKTIAAMAITLALAGCSGITGSGCYADQETGAKVCADYTTGEGGSWHADVPLDHGNGHVEIGGPIETSGK